MRTNLIKVISLGALLTGGLLQLTSCSVKEDRTPCPAYLNVSLVEEQKEWVKEPVQMVGYGVEERFRNGVPVEEYDPYWTKAVRKEMLMLSAHIGTRTSAANGHHILIPIGQQCDSLYAFQEMVDCTGDEAFSEVTLHKQFCTVSVDLMKPATGPNAISNYRFLVEGNTCGFDLHDFQPVGGAFRIEPMVPEGERILSFRVPRQQDESLSLKVWLMMGDDRRVEVGTFAIGHLIKRMGYDWTAIDLEDIFITIDLINGFITVSVADWEHGMTFTFIEQ